MHVNRIAAEGVTQLFHTATLDSNWTAYSVTSQLRQPDHFYNTAQNKALLIPPQKVLIAQIPPRHLEEKWISKRSDFFPLQFSMWCSACFVSQAGHKNSFPQRVSQEKRTHSTKQKDFPPNILATCTVEKLSGGKNQLSEQNIQF